MSLHIKELRMRSGLASWFSSLAWLVLALGVGIAVALLLPISAQAQERVLRVVGDENYPPYLFLNADGKAEGFIVDLWKLWERKTGIEVELKATKWEDAQRILLRGDADVIENIFETPQRAPLYDFSKPYADLPVNIYRDVSIGGLASPDSLRGFRVGVMAGDACVETLKSSGIDTLVYYENYTKLIEAAKAQDIKVFCLDEYPANFYLYRQGAYRQFVKAFELYRGQFHRAVRKGNIATLRLIDQGMAAISGPEMDALRRKWLSVPADYGRYAQYAFEAVALLALALALLALWAFSLRRAVAIRTAERAQAEQALVDREVQLRSIGDNLPNGFIFQYEASGNPPRFRYISAGVEGTLGYKPEPLTVDASPLFALIPAESLAEYATAAARSAQTFSDLSELLPADLPDGRRRWLMIRSRPRRSPAGSVVWDGLALDVTDTREAQAKLLESEQRFRRLFEDSREAITLVEDGRFVDANRAALETMRIDSRERFCGLRPADISPERQPDGQLSAAKAQEAIRVAFAAGSNQLEWEHVRADGERFFAEVLLTPMTFGDRRLLHAVWRDITEKKRAEAELDRYRRELESLVAERTSALQASNEQLAHTQFAMDRAGIGIGWNDAQTGQFLYANDEICRQLGYTREELLRLGLGDINRDFPSQAVQQIAADLRVSGGSVRIEAIHRRKDGSSYPVAVTAYLHHAGGQEWFIAFFEDITARKAAQAELVIAKDAAEAADRAKSAFLANMSHEIRTPMNAIIGMTHLVLNTDPTPRQREYLQKIQGSGQHLMGILNDILDLSKIEVGKLVIERIDFDLEQVLDRVLSLVTAQAAAKGLALLVSVDPNVQTQLVGDPLRIGQVLINYANNAVKFTDRGEISIRVATVGQTDDEIVLHFSVRDTGIGISEFERQCLFQSFQQADTSTTRKFGGTGLGLAIAKRLAELMGGEVGVESAPGAGSCFWFTARLGRGKETVKSLVPVSEPFGSEAGERRPATAETGSRPPNIAAIAARRMLLVEDNDLNQESDSGWRETPVARPGQSLHGIAGLDVALGLREALGHEALYRSLLSKLVEGQGDVPALIAAALAGSDWSGAERLAHTLKGVAAKIGAGELRSLAEQLEQAIRNRAPLAVLGPLQGEIARVLSLLIEAIAERLTANAAPVGEVARPLETDQARDLFIRLAALLRSDDLACRQLLNENETLLETALGERFPSIAKAIRYFDFADALSRLKEAVAPQGIEL